MCPCVCIQMRVPGVSVFSLWFRCTLEPFLCMLSGDCLLPVCVCQCVQGELGCQWTEGLVAVWKTFAPQSGVCVCETVCVWLEGIVALKGLMWRLMQRDNAGFVSTVPMSLVSYSPVEVYWNPMVREKGGGGIPVMMSVVWESKKLRNRSHMKWTRWKELARCCLAHRYVLSCFRLWDRNQRPACFFFNLIFQVSFELCVLSQLCVFRFHAAHWYRLKGDLPRDAFDWLFWPAPTACVTTRAGVYIRALSVT